MVWLKKKDNLRDLETHFEFGLNWLEYANKVTTKDVEESQKGLNRLLLDQSLDGKSFLDIGCGSGIHSLAALIEGAARVVSCDIDPKSVEATRALARKFAPSAPLQIEQKSVFDLSPADLGKFDVVYSWGVLHHTGDLYKALNKAGEMVEHGGTFIFALYRRTWMDWFWCLEKKIYYKSKPAVKKFLQLSYIGVFRVGLFLTNRSYKTYVKNYNSKRGMNFYNDIHDWLGGWPYEAIDPEEVYIVMNKLGFKKKKMWIRKGKVFGREIGLLGSGNNEYNYQKSGFLKSES